MKHIVMKHAVPLLLSLLALMVAGCRRDDARAVYDRYAVRAELQVSFVKGFRMDSIRGDFVILEAPDTATWFALAKEFGIPRMFLEKPDVTKRYISAYRDRRDPTQWPPSRTLPSGEQEVDEIQSCKWVVDIIDQKIFLIFAETIEDFNRIEERLLKFKY